MAQTLTTDVLVVGGGGAAARAAYEARRTGAKVVLAVKGRFGALGTRGAGATASSNSETGGFKAKGVPGRTVDPDQVFADIVQAGLGTADPRLARILADEAESSRLVLEELGVRWHVGFGIKSHGVPLMVALEQALRTSDVVIKDRTMVTDLLVRDGRCVGAMAVDEDGETWVIKAKSVILGTGGNGQMFRFNLDPNCVTGDGYAMAYEAGAELMNMEFLQIFLGSVYPNLNQMSIWISGHVWRATNRNGERFIERYLPPGGTVEEMTAQKMRHNPFSTRDSLSRFIHVGMIKETVAGRAGVHGGFDLDLTDPGIAISDDQLDFWSYRGIHLREEPLQVNVVQQCCNGGLRVDENGESTLPGLYAAGEAGTGYHGCDRLGGNMLAVSQVFGNRAGRHAARVSREMAQIEPDAGQVRDLEAALMAVQTRKGDQTPRQAIAKLQVMAWEKALAVRNEQGLTELQQGAKGIAEELVPRVAARTPLEVQNALELRNLLTNAQIVAGAARLRRESRGGHYREDYPQRDDANWRKVVLVRKGDGEPRLTPFVLDPTFVDRPGDMGPGRWG